MPIASAHTYVFLYQRHKLPYHQESLSVETPASSAGIFASVYIYFPDI